MIHLTETGYTLEFCYNGEPGFAFSFNCSQSGVIDESKLGTDARAILIACRLGIFKGKKIAPAQLKSWRAIHQAVCQCDCGAKIELRSLINTCIDCHANYNNTGERLDPEYVNIFKDILGSGR